MTILITGGAGFIGTNFVRHLRAERPDEAIVVLDALTYAGVRSNVEGEEGVDLVEGDIRDEALVASLLADRGIDRIVHFAAESHVDRSIDGPDAFISTNIVGTHALLKAAKAAWLDTGSGRPHRFHHVSTDEVYGTLTLDDPAFSETTPYAPNSPYAASKASSDHLVRAYAVTFGLDTVTTNCSNNYGPYQFPEKLIPVCLLNTLEGRPLPIYGDGQQRRDWLYVEDHCRGILAALENGKSGETYNIGGGAEMPNLDLVHRLCDEVDAAFARDPQLADRFPAGPCARGAGAASLITHVEDRLGHDRRYAIDDSKARADIGYEPKMRFEDGIARTIDWYLQNEIWWRELR